MWGKVPHAHAHFMSSGPLHAATSWLLPSSSITIQAGNIQDERVVNGSGPSLGICNQKFAVVRGCSSCRPRKRSALVDETTQDLGNAITYLEASQLREKLKLTNITHKNSLWAISSSVYLIYSALGEIKMAFLNSK